MATGTQQTPKWLYAMIAFLAFVVILESGILLMQWKNRKKESAKENIITPVSDYPGSYYAAPPTRSPSYVTPPRRSPLWTDPWAWDPFETMAQMQERMHRMLEQFNRFAAPGLVGNFVPSVDLEETPDAYIVRSDLPGLEKDKIDVTVRGNLLTIRGVRQMVNESGNPQSGYYAQERSYGSFSRTLMLPGPVDESGVSAEYKKGVLTIRLPKAKKGETAQKVQIQ